MELNMFISNFADQFEVTDHSVFAVETCFRNLDEWSSLVALSVMAMINEEYNVKLKGDDMRNSQTIQDLFNIVKSKLPQ